MVDYNSTSTLKEVHYEIHPSASVIDAAVDRGFCPIGGTEDLRKTKSTVGYVGRQGNNRYAGTRSSAEQCHACHASHDFERKCGNARDDVGRSRRSGHDVLPGRGPAATDTLLR